ncbi:hypothetical protein [Pseudoalteromonas sp. P1-8]|uniref:hypothetical protein n=1 Tax=Pseudoalteromonas sp. P1-8 TaxID=1710353 RepID=UPI0006DD1B6D|nr:hypothetical protein [Pseudoalteromonas sp. P1-8]KPW04924.1 hypothetical protein AN213_00420 [Pseudoalteromonas sp. P1-8]
MRKEQVDILNKNFKKSDKIHKDHEDRITHIENDLQRSATRDAIAQNYSQASTYANVIIIAGYVAFFNLWHVLIGKSEDWIVVSSGISAIISLTAFVTFEVFKIFSSTNFLIESDKVVKDRKRSLDEIAKMNEIRKLATIKYWKIQIYTTIIFGAIGTILVLAGYIQGLFEILF